ncbi:Hsp20 family protein [uncultured Clostridium sp.]|uniref:Hsp20 family protein n=1 Tax=uncultured Clostridium sp. TaxID=59620 RepID=UPI0026234CB7|nr:Hsp20 family protein [uncultured Clostridium sp.]
MFNQNYMGFMENFYSEILNNSMNMYDDFMENVENKDIQLEIKNEENRYLLEGTFPGIKKQDIKINYKNDHLHVKVKRNQVFSNENSMCMIVINDSRDFTKNFYIPNSDIENLQFSFEEYKLRLEIPKKYFIKEDEGTIIDVDYEEE